MRRQDACGRAFPNALTCGSTVGSCVRSLYECTKALLCLIISQETLWYVIVYSCVFGCEEVHAETLVCVCVCARIGSSLDVRLLRVCL